MFRAFGYFLLLLGALAVTPAESKSKTPILIALTGETQQAVMARIAGAALRKAGFKVGYVEVPAGDVIQAVTEAKVHVDPEFIVDVSNGAYETALADNKIQTLGGRKGNGREEPVQKVVWPGVKRKWPYARKMLKTMIFPTEELQGLSDRAETDGIEPVVADWMKQNRKRWKRWVSASTNWMKP